MCRNKRLLFLQREDEVENKEVSSLGTRDFGALDARVTLTLIHNNSELLLPASLESRASFPRGERQL